MVEFRYHRMARNDRRWREPHGGRLGQSNDYVGTTGFGHEDWNFTRETWPDGRCHLYLQQPPAIVDRSEIFNIALGVRTEGTHHLVGLCEGARYEYIVPTKEMARRRAEQIHSLELEGCVQGYLKGLSLEEKVESFLSLGEVYWVSVAPEHLLMLETPIRIPDEIVKPTYNRYGLKRLSERQYGQLRAAATRDHPPSDTAELDFPEGTLVARWHLTRERDAGKAEEAKRRFLNIHDGELSCEACGWSPGQEFPGVLLERRIIEVHHDVPLSSPDHGGRTRVSDLRLLCPNCHRAIHSIRPWMTVDDFKARFFPQSK